MLSKSFSKIFFHWNSYVVVVHDFAKIPLIHSDEFSHNTNVKFLSETFLDSLIKSRNLKRNVFGSTYGGLTIHQFPK